MIKANDQNKEANNKRCRMTPEGQAKLRTGIRSKFPNLIQDEKINYNAVADLVSLDRDTLKKISEGQKNVNYSSIMRLDSYFDLKLGDDTDFKCGCSDSFFSTQDLEDSGINEEFFPAITSTSNMEEKAQDIESMDREKRINKALDTYANVSRERLYGVESYSAKLKAYLEDKHEWLVSVVGSGGVGKTSVVEKSVRDYAANAGFTNVAWVTAKRTYMRYEDLSENQIGSSINLESMINDIALQLQITLPSSPNLDDRFKYLQSKLRENCYLVVIDNLETLDDNEKLIQRFNPYNPTSNLIPSTVILTSRKKIQSQNSRLKEIELNGIDYESTLELIRHKGDHVERIRNAPDNELLHIHEASQGNPLITLLIVSLISTYSDLSLSEVIKKVLEKKSLYSYLYEELLNAISEKALNILVVMADHSEISNIHYCTLKTDSKLEDQDFETAIRELTDRFLIQTISSLTDKPRYSIHSMIYQFLRSKMS